MDDIFDRLTKELADRYDVERELGAGGMAIVFLATDLKHHRQVAIKVLRPELSATLGTQRFLREIGIAAQLQHPHILPLHDSGEADGLFYYVMPYVDGPSLGARLSRDEVMPVDEAIQIVREVAGALDYAHNVGIVHRDIKPDNILLSRGHAMIADFGIARAVSAARGHTLTVPGSSIGSPAYMSPEQINGSEVDARTDQYALGCMAYEMLAGRPAFKGDTIESLFHQHLSVDPPPLTDLRPEVPSTVSDAVARALAKQPDGRFATTAEFAEALADTTGSFAVRSPWGASRRRAAYIGTAVGAVAVALAIAFGIPNGAPALPRLAVLPFENLGAAADEYVADGITEAITTRLTAIGQLRVVSRQSAIRIRRAACGSFPA